MNNKKLKFTTAMISIVAILFTMTGVVYADASLKLSSESRVAVNNTFSVTVTLLNETADLAAFEFDVQYDTSKFAYVSASVSGTKEDNASANFDETTNNLKVAVANYKITGQTILTIRFKTKAIVDNSEIRLKNITLGRYEPVEEIPATFLGAISVSVFQPSTNADLSKLSIAPGTLTPAFTSANTQYTVQVPESVTTLSVDAVPADAKSKVAVSGHTGLKTGENIVKVVVTSESGATKTYTIKAYKAVPTPTLAATPTPAATALINGNPFTVATLDAGQNPPAGFTATTTVLAGQTVPAYANAQANVVLLYLSDGAGRKDFYVYDAIHSAFTLFQTLTIPERSYVVLVPDATVTVPTGFVATTLTIGGHTVSGYLETTTTAGPSPRTLVYLMDAGGTKKLYVYEASTGDVRLFSDVSAAPTAAATPGPTEAATPTPSPTGTPAVNNAGTLSTYLLIIIALAILVAVLSGILIYLLISRKAYHQSQKPPTIRRVG